MCSRLAWSSPHVPESSLVRAGEPAAGVGARVGDPQQCGERAPAPRVHLLRVSSGSFLLPFVVSLCFVAGEGSSRAVTCACLLSSPQTSRWGFGLDPPRSGPASQRPWVTLRLLRVWGLN